MATKAETKPTDLIPMNDEMRRVMTKYGVTPDKTYTPPAPTIYKSNLRELCKLTTPLFDGNGDQIRNVKAHTGPLMFLGKKDEVTPKESRYSGYDGFYIYAILHPKHGETVITIGRPTGDKSHPIVDFLDTLQAGAWFQVAEVNTNSGFGVYIVVPVQHTA